MYYREITISLSLSKKQVHRLDGWFLTDRVIYFSLEGDDIYTAFATSAEYDYYRTKAYVDVDIIFEVEIFYMVERKKIEYAIKKELQRILLFPEK